VWVKVGDSSFIWTAYPSCGGVVQVTKMLAKSFARSLTRPSNVASSMIARSLAGPVGPATYTERQERLGRPVSPHVDIYKFPPAAISSITNRFTGIGLSVG
jgi:hypothetical protein